jgi:hypothetical protein
MMAPMLRTARASSGVGYSLSKSETTEPLKSAPLACRFLNSARENDAQTPGLTICSRTCSNGGSARRVTVCFQMRAGRFYPPPGIHSGTNLTANGVERSDEHEADGRHRLTERYTIHQERARNVYTRHDQGRLLHQLDPRVVLFLDFDSVCDLCRRIERHRVMCWTRG